MPSSVIINILQHHNKQICRNFEKLENSIVFQSSIFQLEKSIKKLLGPSAEGDVVSDIEP